MNPLSSLRLASGIADFQADALAKTGPGASPIPTGDLAQLGAPAGLSGSANAASTSGSFSNYLGQMVGEVNAQQGAANQAVQGLLSGQNVSLHQAMISMEEASVSFQLMVEVRNRLLDSYQELMRMQV